MDLCPKHSASSERLRGVLHMAAIIRSQTDSGPHSGFHSALSRHTCSDSDLDSDLDSDPDSSGTIDVATSSAAGCTGSRTMK